jgi:FlaA1/EpsC-like NDP-sugar epimerase
MGATKRFAELLTLGQRSRLFRPLAVRFGNILGSSGSVVEIMFDAVRAGRPVPVTAPDATRFFMTAQEAVSLVLKADLIGRGGEVFWLDMGQPIRIGELAERVIALASRAGEHRSEIEVIGLRPGEKMREELTTQGLEMRRTSHSRIWSARQRDVSAVALEHAMRQLRRGCAGGDGTAVLAAIRMAVEDFEPSQAAVAAARRMSLVSASTPVGISAMAGLR